MPAVDVQQDIKTSLSGFNTGVALGQIADATVSGANTFATFRSRVAGNITAESNTEENQAGNMIVLRALDRGNAAGVLTDTRLNGLTTVAGVRALFTADDPSLSSTFTGSNPQ